MDDSSTPRPAGATRAVAACSIVAGPLGAGLYESGHGHLWMVLALALTGVVIGFAAIVRGARLLGAASLAVNSGVATLYGFLALFFGLGGSR